MNDIFKSNLGPHFVADDNDNPTSGGSGQVEPSRAAGGVSENDVIAPLLKSCKGPESGDEEYPISKSEMLEMGMDVGDWDDGWYKIAKSEMARLGCTQHVEYLAERKQRVAKSFAPNAQSIQKSNAPQRPRVPPLVQWSNESDKQMEAYLRGNGGVLLGPGNDEPIGR